MNIRYATDKDAQNWNIYVESHPQSTPYHQYAWKQVIQKTYGHDCYYLLAEDHSNNIIGILPTVKIKPFLFSGKLCALPFCDIGESLANNTEITDKLIRHALKLAKKLRLRTFEHRASLTTASSDDKQLSGKKVRMILDLPESSDELMKSFKSKFRTKIKLPTKKGCTSREGSFDLINPFYEVFSINMRDLGSPVHPKKLIENILKAFPHQAKIFIIERDTQPLAGGIVIGFKDTLFNPWASSLKDYSNLRPNTLLYWNLLEFACQNGYKHFDFGRSTVGEGTYKFKQQWGAQAFPLNWQTFNSQSMAAIPQPDSNGKNKHLRSFAETLWKRLPVSTSVLIGSRIRKYISL